MYTSTIESHEAFQAGFERAVAIQQELIDNTEPSTGKVMVYLDLYYRVEGESDTRCVKIEPTLAAYVALFAQDDSEVVTTGVEIAKITRG